MCAGIIGLSRPLLFLIKNAFVFDAMLNEININVMKYIKWINENEKISVVQVVLKKKENHGIFKERNGWIQFDSTN
jgi:hypothetical protein